MSRDKGFICMKERREKGKDWEIEKKKRGRSQ